MLDPTLHQAAAHTSSVTGSGTSRRVGPTAAARTVRPVRMRARDAVTVLATVRARASLSPGAAAGT